MICFMIFSVRKDDSMLHQQSLFLVVNAKSRERRMHVINWSVFTACK